MYKHLLLLGVLLTFFSAVAQAESAALIGLTEFEVEIIGTSPEWESVGLSALQLRTDVELRLRKAGMPVLPWDPLKRNKLRPKLVVSVLLFQSKDRRLDVVSKQVQITLRESVTANSFRRGSIQITDADTWQSYISFGLTNSKSEPAGIRQSVGDLIDQFINEFLTANPRLAL